jgi:cell wall-associated NlpC family hydrolase
MNANEIFTYVSGLEKDVATLNARITAMENAPKAPESWETKADIIIAIAKTLDTLAIPYVFGGESRNGMDCSGFTQLLFKQVGYNLPRVSHDQSKIGSDVEYKDLRAGDLIFYDFNNDGKITHVAICMGGGKMIHTNTPATGINIQSTYWNYASIAKIKRVLT